MQHLPIARYRFTARAEQPLPLPDYAGSLLRGQFGAALRKLACMTRQKTCPGCPLRQTCPYSRIFEAPAPPKGAHGLQDFSQIPNPYVIEPPAPGARMLQPGEELVFHTVLVGHAIDQLALVIVAWQRALASGLTKARASVHLDKVEWIDQAAQPHPVWQADRPTVADHPATLPWPTPGAAQPTSLALTLHTPLRLQHQGRPLGVGELTARALIAAVARRAALLLEFHARLAGWGDEARHIAHLGSQLDEERDMRWFDWTRYSGRQHQEMTLGGVLGQWTLRGDADTLVQIAPWLWLGQWLHVGKNATMGLGGYAMRAMPPDEECDAADGGKSAHAG